MIKQAKKLMAEWEEEGMFGFFMDFFTAKTGFQVDSEEFAEVLFLIASKQI